MQFKVDENLPPEIADILIQNGHDATTVLQEGLGGMADPGISDVCREEQRILVTLDMDFADIREYPLGYLPGTIVMRLDSQDKATILDVFSEVIPHLSEDDLTGKLWLVEQGRIRIRGADN